VLRILRAFAWIRWRVFVNTLEKTSARDRVQRMSLAVERLVPIALTVLLIPSAIALAGLAAFAGVQLASGAEESIAFDTLRILLLVGTLMAIVGPMMMPVADRTNPVRFLLLPIPVRALYVAQTGAIVADPWIALLLPAVLAVPVGLAIGGAGAAAVVALAAAILLVVTVIGLSALTTTLIQLLLRDRRRGELVALALIIVLPMIGFLPSLLGASRRASAEARRGSAEARNEARDSRKAPPAWVVSAGNVGLSMVPSELYTTAVRRAARNDIGAAARRLAALVAAAMGLHAISFVIFRRILSSPASTGRRSVSSMHGLWTRSLPGVSPPTSAVALALVRLALRTPRGRAIVLLPVAVTLLFAFVALRSGSFTVGPFPTRSGLGFAAFTSFLALLASIPISMNQFAVDGAGLTLTLLSPITTRRLLAGKALGTALVAFPGVLVAMALSVIAFPGGSPAMWATLALSFLAIYVASAPLAAMLSIIFPRVVNLNSIGRDSNAHGAAGFLGLLSFAGAALPCIALAFLAVVVLEQPWLAPLFLVIWNAVAFGVARLLLAQAERLFEARRESLAMLI